MASIARDSRRSRHKILSSRRFRTVLLRQIAIFTVLLTVATVAGLGWIARYARPSVFDIAVLLTMWTLTGGLGISVGFHRLLTQRSFKTFPTIETALAMLGSIAANGPVVCWVTVHRRHHKHNEQPENPRTPCNEDRHCQSLHGMLRAHIGWTF